MALELSYVSDYLSIESADSRIRFLKKYARGDFKLPLPLVQDLLNANLASEERQALIAACDATEKLVFEDIVTRGFYAWDQNLASLALRLWAERTDRLLWHRTVPMADDAQISQRVSYTLLDLAWQGAGRLLLEKFVRLNGLKDMSPAFLALFYQRASQWSFEHPKLMSIGLENLHSVSELGFGGDKVLPQILGYFLKFAPSELDDPVLLRKMPRIWGDIVRSLRSHGWDQDSTLGLQSKVGAAFRDPSILDELSAAWPAIWERHLIPAQLIADTLCSFAAQDPDLRANPTVCELMGGVPSSILADAVMCITDDRLFAFAITHTFNYFLTSEEERVLDNLKSRLVKTNDPSKLLEHVPQRLRIKLGSSNAGVFKDIRLEAGEFQSIHSPLKAAKAFRFHAATQRTGEDVERQAFIDLAYFGKKSPGYRSETFWGALCLSWQNPEENQLDELAKKARKAPNVFQLFYIETLGRFVGVDKAALKLLDFVRSDEPEIVSAVIHALASIGTQRATQELVAFLTRPNITFDLQMEITQILKEKDLRNLQSELRSALADIFIDPLQKNLQWELKATLSDLLHPVANFTDKDDQKSMPTTGELDEMLKAKTPNYTGLSSEAKRALRTAQFFQLQIQSARELKTIDISPVIDMQYKALELSFRENFEAPCSALINEGILQRKLDVIGYARPIVQAMDKFEYYIEKQPIISQIPFFSRFKLRKMLRAICQYRRGKRFTLDGLKAFGLFFICFSRHSCDYGLQNLFPAQGFTDLELAEFVMALHKFQDFRNRAAHEGFHPEASSNLDAIWSDTVQIIDTMVRFREGLGMIETKASRNLAVVNKSA